MKKVAEISISQYRQLVGQLCSNDWYFNPTVMTDGRFFISEEEINAYSGQDFAYIKDLTLIDYVNVIPDTTPPTPTGYGIEIPSKYLGLGLFPNDSFSLNGFTIPLTAYNSGLAVDLAYLGWEAFRNEQDYKYNEAVKNSFSQLWYELLTLYQNNQIVQL